MREGKLKVIESIDKNLKQGLEFTGLILLDPCKDKSFYMYTNEVNPANNRRYILINNIDKLRVDGDEYIIYSKEGVFSLKVKYTSFNDFGIPLPNTEKTHLNKNKNIYVVRG